MKIPSLWPPTKRTVTVAIAIIALIVALALAILAFMSAQQYQQNVANYKSSLRQDLTRTNQLLLDHKENEQALPDRAVEQIHTTLDQAIRRQPGNPRLLWVNLQSDEDTQAQLQLHAKLSTARDKLEVAAQTGSYQRQTSQILKQIQQGVGQNADQITILAKTWSQANDELENVIVPHSIQNQHQKLLTLTSKTSKQLSELAKLHQDKKESEFNKLELELAHTISELHEVAQEYVQVITQLDSELAAALTELEQALAE